MSMKCRKCGSDELHETTVDQDPVGNDLRAIVCFACNEVYAEQGSAGECLHMNYEIDEIGRGWCIECGDYLGERM